MSAGAPLSRPDRPGLAPAALAALLLAPVSAAAQAGDVHGRFEVQAIAARAQGDSVLPGAGQRVATDALANLRITWEPRRGPWSLSAHYLIAADAGDGARLANDRPLATPPATWLDLTDTLSDEGDVAATHRIDRLALAYSTDDVVVRVGRQALTWGSGLVFRPMDLFNPFGPAAIDTEYKPGVDMIYVQRLFADGSDLQLIAVPRQPRRGRAVSEDASSFAAHGRTRIAGLGATVLMARDHGQWVGAVGVDGALGGATWNVELVPLVPRDGKVRLSGVANITTAVTLFERNATVFAEYFHSGVGETGDLALTNLPPVLADRLARGQVFTLRRDYLAAGLTLEVTPLLTAGATVIAGLNDGSVLALASATYSLGDEAVLVVGVQAPAGGPDTEYGGLPLVAGGGALQGPPTRVYLQLRRYF